MMQWDLGSARVARALVGIPPTSRGGTFQDRLVLPHEPPKPSADADGCDRDGRAPVLNRIVP